MFIFQFSCQKIVLDLLNEFIQLIWNLSVQSDQSLFVNYWIIIKTYEFLFFLFIFIIWSNISSLSVSDCSNHYLKFGMKI